MVENHTDPIDILSTILKRSGQSEADVRDNEVDRYFLFDQISDPADLELAWRQFPSHEIIRARAEEVDDASDIVPGFGYRTPKPSNCCTKEDLQVNLRKHIAAMGPLILRQDYNSGVLAFLEKPYEIQVVQNDTDTPPVVKDNELFGAIGEAMGEFKLNHFEFTPPIQEVLYDWATYLTTCDEVTLYLLWPLLTGVDDMAPDTPRAGFDLWRFGCRDRYWIKDNNFASGIVYIQPPWT